MLFVFGKWYHVHCCDQFTFFVNGEFTENFHFLVLHLQHFFMFGFVWRMHSSCLLVGWDTARVVPYIWESLTCGFFSFLSQTCLGGGDCKRSVLWSGNYSYVMSVIQGLLAKPAILCCLLQILFSLWSTWRGTEGNPVPAGAGKNTGHREKVRVLQTGFPVCGFGTLNRQLKAFVCGFGVLNCQPKAFVCGFGTLNHPPKASICGFGTLNHQQKLLSVVLACWIVNWKPLSVALAHWIIHQKRLSVNLAHRIINKSFTRKLVSCVWALAHWIINQKLQSEFELEYLAFAT